MKKKLIAITIFLMICIASTFIYAAIDAKVQINPSSTTVKPGEEVIFTVKIKDIVSENGANGIEGNISYDTEVFEDIQDSNVTKAGSWDVAYYNKKVIAEGLSAIKSDSDVINIKLKVKDDANLVGKTGTVSLNNTVVYNTEKVDLGTVSGSVKISKDSGNTTPTEQPTSKPTSTPDGGNEDTESPSTKPGGTVTTPTPTANANQNNGNGQGNLPITNIDTNTSTGNSTSGSTSSGTSGSSSGTTIKGSTTATTSLPKAGIGSTIAVLAVLALVLGTVAYIKLNKYKEI